MLQPIYNTFTFSYIDRETFEEIVEVVTEPEQAHWAPAPFTSQDAWDTIVQFNLYASDTELPF